MYHKTAPQCQTQLGRVETRHKWNRLGRPEATLDGLSKFAPSVRRSVARLDESGERIAGDGRLNGAETVDRKPRLSSQAQERQRALAKKRLDTVGQSGRDLHLLLEPSRE